MLEVRFHGRGGAGVKTAAQLLGKAAFLSGFQTQDFSLYGAERRGAPVVSFTRIDKKKILERGYITKPDVVVILDDSLDFDRMLKGTDKMTLILVNTNRSHKLGLDKKENYICTDATTIALDIIGRPIPNTVMLGVLVKKLKGKIPFKNLEEAIEKKMKRYSEKIIEANKRAAKVGYGSIHG
ncbi:MAG: pyruvate ferredoxin oxidoreductase [Candidatus Aenigmarchaeota archaeon]|nr:pyruvate ferredoxin oxidoreductase [Candidatus Aenigmarchaeota archaeon]